jgi:lipopolysaccharide assembly outer membrane protein LptD (OstA)
MDRYSAAVTLWARHKDRLFVEYRYDRNTDDDVWDEYEVGGFIEPQETTEDQKVNSLYTALRLGVTDRLALTAAYERDFVFDRADSYSFGFIYESQCWTVETAFGLDEGDLGVGLRVRLHGIGDFGF